MKRFQSDLFQIYFSEQTVEVQPDFFASLDFFKFSNNSSRKSINQSKDTKRSVSPASTILEDNNSK